MAKNTNFGVLIGRLTDDAKLEKVGNWDKATFNVCFNTAKKDAQGKWSSEANYLNFLELWGPRAVTLSKFLIKGQQVCISYSLAVDQWEKDGKKQSKMKLRIEDIELIGGKAQPQQKTSVQQVAEAFGGTAEPDGFPEDFPI